LLHHAVNQILKRPLLIKQPEIGGLIRDFRLLTGLTQEQFAAYLGVTYATINRWENRRSSPSPMAIDKIEQKLGEWGKQGQELLQKYLGK
jgi:putative transcriptional regulator